MGRSPSALACFDALVTKPVWESLAQCTNSWHIAQLSTGNNSKQQIAFKLLDSASAKRIFFARLLLITLGSKTIDDFYKVFLILIT